MGGFLIVLGSGYVGRTQMMKRWVWVGVALSMMGCAERYSIRPTQLSRLNDDLAVNDGSVRMMVKLETSDGRIVEVDPPVLVYITTGDGKEHTFCSPLRVVFEGGAVVIKHNCGRPERIYGDEIAKVEVEETL